MRVVRGAATGKGLWGFFRSRVLVDWVDGEELGAAPASPAARSGTGDVSGPGVELEDGVGDGGVASCMKCSKPIDGFMAALGSSFNVSA